MTSETLETPLAPLIGFLGDNFRHRAVLEGGMGLRLMESPRSTNDADFVAVPHGSRKDAVDEIRSALLSVDGLAFTERMERASPVAGCPRPPAPPLRVGHASRSRRHETPGGGSCIPSGMNPARAP